MAWRCRRDSLPPCGGGLGWGVGRQWHGGATLIDPHPRPLPTRGRGGVCCAVTVQARAHEGRRPVRDIIKRPVIVIKRKPRLELRHDAAEVAAVHLHMDGADGGAIRHDADIAGDMLDRVGGKERDAIIGDDLGARKEASDPAHETGKFPERDRAAVLDRHDVGLVGMKLRGAVDPRPDEIGAGVVRYNVGHFSLSPPQPYRGGCACHSRSPDGTAARGQDYVYHGGLAACGRFIREQPALMARPTPDYMTAKTGSCNPGYELRSGRPRQGCFVRSMIDETPGRTP